MLRKYAHLYRKKKEKNEERKKRMELKRRICTNDYRDDSLERNLKDLEKMILYRESDRERF